MFGLLVFWEYINLLGVTMWEILEQKTPYDDISNPREILQHICVDKIYLPRPTRIEIPDELWNIITSCWLDPHARPTFEQLSKQLSIVNVPEEEIQEESSIQLMDVNDSILEAYQSIPTDQRYLKTP